MELVYPITDRAKLDAMADYLFKTNTRDYVLFELGINIGLRVTDFTQQKVGFYRQASQKGYIDMTPEKTKKFNKKVNKIYLVDTAPNRKDKIMKNLEKYDIDINDFNIEIVDIYNRRNFSYEKEIKVVYKGIDMHPQYEAKAFSWLYHESGIDIHNNRNLFWIIGSKPKLRKRRVK